MFGHNTCIFEKFASCKKGKNCNYQHPTLVCDDKECNIKLCDKKHPQDCLFHTIFNECRNGDSCRYQHKNSEVSTHVNEDKYRELEEKYIVLYEKYEIMVKRIESLENDKKQSSRSRSLADINKICTRSRSQVDVKRKIDIDCDKTLTKKNKVETESMETEDEVIANEVNNQDGSYCIGDDPVYEQVLKCEYKFGKDLDKDVGDVRSNMKCRTIDETMKKLRNLREKIKNKRIEMKNIKKHQKIENASEDTFEVMDSIEIVVNRLEKLPKNKFKKGAEKELKLTHEDIEELWSQKESNLHGYFDGPDY